MNPWNLYLFRIFSSRMLTAGTIACGLIGCNGQVYTVVNPQGVIPRDASYVQVIPESKCRLLLPNNKSDKQPKHSQASDTTTPLDKTNEQTNNSQLLETTASGKPCKFEGILAYHPTNFIEIYWTTSVLQATKDERKEPGGGKTKDQQDDKKKKPEEEVTKDPQEDEKKKTKVLRTYTSSSADKWCQPQIRIKQVIRPDYERPYQLFYAPGLLEKYSFKTEFDQGVLKSINTDSTPDRGETFKNVATALGEIAKFAEHAAGIPFEGERELPEKEVHLCTDEPVLKFIKRTEDVCPDGLCKFADYEWKKKSILDIHH